MENPISPLKNRLLPALKRALSHPLLRDYRALLLLWCLLGLAAGLAKMSGGRHNNFLIFRYVWDHVVNRLPLYVEYPAEYFDHNHYGPFFSLIIAPFSLMPERLGLLAWVVALAALLWWAVRRLPLRLGENVFIYWFCENELLTALFMQQFNVATAALIVLTWVLIEKERDFWAALCIMVGLFVKLYGVVGLAFFFFSRHKGRLLLGCAVWAVVCFAVPMLYSSPDYVWSQYVAWFERLQVKNADNLFAPSQNISLLGLVRKVSGSGAYPDWWLILGGLVLFALPYRRIGQYRYRAFRTMWLASVLMFVVLFSTGSESSTYIIPFVGICLWYLCVPWKRSGWDVALMVFAFVLTSLSPSDLFPRYVRETWVRPYALKALPVVLIWLKLVWEMNFRSYAPLPPQPARQEDAAGARPAGAEGSAQR